MSAPRISVARSSRARTVTSARGSPATSPAFSRDTSAPSRAGRRGRRCGWGSSRGATVTSDPGSAAAPQGRTRAEEMSPGSPPPAARPRRADGDRQPVQPHRDAHPESIRSVWSRERSGSVTWSRPRRRARRAGSRSSPARSRLEDVARAAERAAVHEDGRQAIAGARGESAPIRRRGSITRRTGRLRSEASPVRTETPARREDSHEEPEARPELPQSMTSPAPAAAPADDHDLAALVPDRRAERLDGAPGRADVLRVEEPVTRVSPDASAPKRSERWTPTCRPGLRWRPGAARSCGTRASSQNSSSRAARASRGPRAPSPATARWRQDAGQVALEPLRRLGQVRVPPRDLALDVEWGRPRGGSCP